MNWRKAVASVAGCLMVAGGIAALIKTNKKEMSADATLQLLQVKMMEQNFDPLLIEELIATFNKRIDTYGEKAFTKWLSKLHYSVPEEFQEEQVAITTYEKYQTWIDEEVEKLENETKLPWQTQTEDLENLDGRARKAQLVLRHRMTELAYELI
ncbi:MAG: hypothetical protein LPK26_14635 [Bacillaceae bacterium]|nr:hypothetical protein [Bacillaceae bacterium]